jgi:hypothetical protein
MACILRMDEMNIPPATAAYLLKQSYVDLLGAAEKLGEKITWSPNEKGRTALDQVAECIVIGNMLLALLEGTAPLAYKPDVFQSAKDAIDTKEKATTLCTTIAERLALLVAQQTTEQLNTIVDTPFGPRSTIRLLMLIYWNNGYHEGQINYIATLA